MRDPKSKSAQAKSAEDGVDEVDTRYRIKVAARRLFAERGVEAVTVREIVSAAGAKNGGALNYYFKSKDNLILDLVREVFQENTDALLDGFGSLERSGGPKNVRDVVALIVHAYKPVADPSRTSARFLSSLLFTRRKMVREFMEGVHFSVYAKMLNYVAQLCPDIPEHILKQRWIYFAWYIVSSQSAYEAHLESNQSSPIWTDYDPIANMIDTGAGLLSAPVETPAVANKSSSKRRTAKARANGIIVY